MRRANLVEAKRLAVFGKQVLHGQARQVEEVAQGVFMFSSSQPAQDGSALFVLAAKVGIHQLGSQAAQERVALLLGRPSFRPRRHFTGARTLS